MTKAAPIQLVYASHDGHTEKLVHHMASLWRTQNVPFSLYNLAQNPACDPFLWPLGSKIVVIAPIRYGYHLKPVETFLRENHAFLLDQDLTMVSLNLTARKPEKNTPETNPYFKKWIKKHGLTPCRQAVFGGRLNYRLYAYWERWAIRLIMKITGGPTSFDTDIDYTDWAQVTALATALARPEAARQEVA